MIAAAIAQAVEIAKEIGSSAKELLPEFSKELSSNTNSLEQANMPIKNYTDYLHKGDITIDEALKDVSQPTDIIPESGNVHLKCINEHLAGKTHEVTGVEYKEKVVDINGNKMEGVFPEFESYFDHQLSEENIKASDSVQAKECNEKLKADLASDSELKGRFSDIQIQMIENGHTPRGFTWHHAPERGNMQLVNTDIHSKTSHTGGRAIWGGGQDFR